jgi:tetratricopeptide (TPR) repeat protein
MMTIPEALALALECQRVGDAPRAEHIYRQILAVDPGQADAWHELGVLAYQAGNFAAAAENFERAIAADPTNCAWRNNLGLTLQQLGRREEAAAHLYEAVRLGPTQPEAYNNLGNVVRELGRPDEALQYLRESLRLKPEDVGAWNNMGVSLADLGHHSEAIVAYQQALRLNPERAETYNNLGSALLVLERFDESVAAFEQAIRLKPDYVEAMSNLSTALTQIGNDQAAAARLQEAIRVRPDFAPAYSNLGNVLRTFGRLPESIAALQHALRLDPQFAEAHSNLAAAYTDLEQLDEAVAAAQMACQLKPKMAHAHYVLGATIRRQGRLVEAEECLRRALQLHPRHADAYSQLGNALAQQGKLDEALECYDRTLELKPDYPETHSNRAIVWLMQGDLERGWSEFEWRWKRKDAATARFFQPRWDGSPLEGRTVLLFVEQGLGDTLNFIRYAPLVKQRGGTVIAECQPALLPLLRGFPGVDVLLPQGAPVPGFDVQAPFMSLPGIFQTRLDSIPAEIPYLFADPGLSEHWHNELEKTPGFKIGIAWQGDPRHKWDRFRSLPLSEFAPLAQLDGARLFSLQKGLGTEQVAAFSEQYPLIDLNERLDVTSGAFMDTAAVMRNLDLVITSDTATAHLAGALGVPVWVVLSFAPDWRWLMDRADSPWYPTMRLFRQSQLGRWDDVFAHVADEVRRVMSEKSQE